MREHKQILERVSLYSEAGYDDNATQKAKAQAEQKLKQLQDWYGSCIVDITQAELHEMFAASGEVGYVINVWIDVPDMSPVVLPDGFLLSY